MSGEERKSVAGAPLPSSFSVEGGESAASQNDADVDSWPTARVTSTLEFMIQEAMSEGNDEQESASIRAIMERFLTDDLTAQEAIEEARKIVESKNNPF